MMTTDAWGERDAICEYLERIGHRHIANRIRRGDHHRPLRAVPQALDDRPRIRGPEDDHGGWYEGDAGS